MSELKHIYLQRYTDGETTWCQDQINDDDVEYILKSEYDTAMDGARHFSRQKSELEFKLRLAVGELDALVTCLELDDGFLTESQIVEIIKSVITDLEPPNESSAKCNDCGASYESMGDRA